MQLLYNIRVRMFTKTEHTRHHTYTTHTRLHPEIEQTLSMLQNRIRYIQN